MTITLHTLKPARGSRHRKIRLGRGNASGRGTYSTKGQKGQRARSGGRNKLKLKGLKRRMLNLPKIGGFTSLYAKSAGINVSVLQDSFKEGERVTADRLYKMGLAEKGTPIKILGDGELKKKLIIVGIKLSASAAEKVKEAGGTVEEAK